MRPLLFIKRHSPDLRLSRAEDRAFEGLGQWQIAASERRFIAPERRDVPLYLRRGITLLSSPAALDLCAGHTGAGGAHSRAIIARMSTNSYRDTAISAIWKLISFSRRLISDHGSIAWHRQRAHEVGEVIPERETCKADGIGGEGPARKAVHLIAFLPSLINGSAVPRWGEVAPRDRYRSIVRRRSMRARKSSGPNVATFPVSC